MDNFALNIEIFVFSFYVGDSGYSLIDFEHFEVFEWPISQLVDNRNLCLVMERILLIGACDRFITIFNFFNFLSLIENYLLGCCILPIASKDGPTWLHPHIAIELLLILKNRNIHFVKPDNIANVQH